MIISFAWTSDAFKDGTKTVTRRKWHPNHKKRFKKGALIHGWSKVPFAGGEFIGMARVTVDAYDQALKDMPDDHFEREGGTRYWKDKAEYIEFMGGPDEVYTVIEFERISDDDKDN